MYFSYFSQKIGLNISCKLSPKCQILFSRKNKTSISKCLLWLISVIFCEIVTIFQDIHNLMSEGNKSRTVAATNMNSESSRSHAVFSIILTQTLTDLQTSVSGENIITCTPSKTSPSELLRSESILKSDLINRADVNWQISLYYPINCISQIADPTQDCSKSIM